MHPLIAELIAGIEQDDEGAFLGASEVAAAACFGFQNYQALEPYAEQLAAQTPSAEDVNELKKALVAHIESSPRPATKAVFALGKFHDPALVPFLRDQLSAHLQEFLDYNAALSHLLCALDNCGEKILSHGEHSLRKTEKLIEDSRQYLAKHGHLFPW